MYTHGCFYKDPVTLITTMHISRTISAGPVSPGESRNADLPDCLLAVTSSHGNTEAQGALPNVAYSAAPNTLCRAPRLDRITIWRKKSNHSLFGAPFAEYAVAYSASKSLIRPLATPIRQLSSLIRRPFVAYSAAK